MGRLDLRSIKSTAAVFIGSLAMLGLNYGGCFRTVEHVAVFGPDRAVVHLDPAAINESLDAYLLHPALLDGALQGLLALLALGGRGRRGRVFCLGALGECG